MSVHITGGTLGFSLGPLLFAPFARALRPRVDAAAGACPGLLVIALFLRRVPPFPHAPRRSAAPSRRFGPYARPLALLYPIVVLRTLTSLSFATFVPVMMTRRGLSRRPRPAASVALYLFASGVGGFFGGPAADRFGPRRVIAWSLVLSRPFLVAAPLVTGWPFVVLLAIGGLFLQSTLPVNVVVRPVARAGQRRHGVVADDGVRLGHRRAERAAGRHDRGPHRHRADAGRRWRWCRCSRPRCTLPLPATRTTVDAPDAMREPAEPVGARSAGP